MSAQSSRAKTPIPSMTGPWRGLLAFALLSMVGAFGPDIAPSPYWPDLDHYIPRYVLLALSIGFGLAAIRSGERADRILGFAVVLGGGVVVVYIVGECQRILSR